MHQTRQAWDAAEERQNPLPDGHGSEAFVFACNELRISDGDGSAGSGLFHQRPRLVCATLRVRALAQILPEVLDEPAIRIAGLGEPLRVPAVRCVRQDHQLNVLTL